MKSWLFDARTVAAAGVAVTLFTLVAACASSDEASPDERNASLAPFAPTRLAAAAMGSGIHLTWKDNSADEAEFVVERREGSGAFSKIASVAFDVVQLHDTGVVAGRVYGYRVQAAGVARTSPYSNEATVPAPASANGAPPPAAPRDNASTVGWDGGAVSFSRHIVPLLQKSCGAANTGCHAREAYGASSEKTCRGWLALEDASLGANFYAGANIGSATGCPDRSLYDRLTQLDAWQEPEGRLRKYIQPNDPQSSYLFSKIAGGPYGDDRPGVKSEPMPMKELLASQDIAMVKKWIESGAPSK